MQNSWYIKTLEPIQIIKVKKIEKVITSSSLNLYRPHIPSQLPNVWRSIPPANFKIQITKIKNQHEYSKTLLAKSLKKKKNPNNQFLFFSHIFPPTKQPTNKNPNLPSREAHPYWIFIYAVASLLSWICSTCWKNGVESNPKMTSFWIEHWGGEKISQKERKKLILGLLRRNHRWMVRRERKSQPTFFFFFFSLSLLFT